MSIPPSSPDASSPDRAAAEQPPGLPSAIGKYRVLRHLGDGATSDVFLCHDDFMRRDVAIKRVHRADGDQRGARFSERFFAAEAALVGRLHHPNVVQIYDAVADLALPYLVMEYVPGGTLRDFCRPDNLLSLDQVIDLSFKCSMALSYVFRQGLIHRDVKPANLLTVLEPDGRVGDVKVSDFGSVLNMGSDMTQVHRVGSLAYMSPEQLEGGELDARADMYSLAAVIYHLIAGRPPFEAASQAALMHQIYHQPPPPLTGMRAGLAPAVDAVVQRALAKLPAERYPGWDEFAAALSALIADDHVPRGQLQAVLDSERFTLLRALEFFANFGDVELWEVVRRARWERFGFGHRLYRKGDLGQSFHILANGGVDVFRDGDKVAHLGGGTSVGEMAYLAPSPDLRRHSADLVITESTTTISFTPDSMAQLSPNCRHLFDEAFIRVLVRRLHAAHEALAHPRRIL
ncbi:serine/threonine-protein kinase [Piscinibacter sakaiensis]|uniref:serine/threonine-protein kinase n=1 Tax=Piscinibacter sakaiensis TaxID=1547922 RepID=UPI003AAA6A75